MTTQNYIWIHCVICGKRFKRKKYGGGHPLTENIRPANCVTCKTSCAREYYKIAHS